MGRAWVRRVEQKCVDRRGRKGEVSRTCSNWCNGRSYIHDGCCCTSVGSSTLLVKFSAIIHCKADEVTSGCQVNANRRLYGSGAKVTLTRYGERLLSEFLRYDIMGSTPFFVISCRYPTFARNLTLPFICVLSKYATTLYMRLKMYPLGIRMYSFEI